MRFALFVAAVLSAAFAVGCKGEPFRPDAGDKEIDAPPKPPWFQPSAGEVKNWDIQLADYDFATAREMMVVDLWDVVPSAQTITYDDATTVMVPAGERTTAIATLKGQGAKVLCHVGMGTVHLADDPDAMKLPGYEASPPDRPTVAGATSTIGWSVPGGSAMERFVDYRNAAVQSFLAKRVKLAKDIGCDGLVAYRIDVSAFDGDNGFPNRMLPEHDKAWIEKVAMAGHDVELSIGGRGVLRENISQTKSVYDWLILERCGEEGCDDARPFVEAQRAVFGLDYTEDQEGTPNTMALQCMRFANAMVDGIIKSALDGSAPQACP